MVQQPNGLVNNALPLFAFFVFLAFLAFLVFLAAFDFLAISAFFAPLDFFAFFIGAPAAVMTKLDLIPN